MSNYVKIKDVPKWAWEYIRPEMWAAKAGCKHCKGRLKTGIQRVTGNPIVCRCAMIDMEAVEATKANPQAAKLLDGLRKQLKQIKRKEIDMGLMLKARAKAGKKIIER